MFKFLVTSVLALAAFAVAQNDPSINSPASLVQCQPVQISWTATKEPVFISIIPGGQPGAPALHDFGRQAPGTKSLTWIVDYKTSTSLTFQIKDSAGAVAYSANVNVQDSSDKSCVDPNQPSVPAPGSTSAAPSGAQSTPAASTPAASTPAGATSATRPAASNSPTSRAAATATSAPTPSSTGAASVNAALPGAQIGWTGLMGILAAFIVA
ncbi:hypothetical protein OPQ81_001853 [Rhizoctonia solani]|nr:hypothetical protein OPQ81_001853 [Rhizoctonia solani]